MKVLVISANTLPSSPSGPAYVAGAALNAGHTVEVFECLFAKDPVGELEQHIIKFKPDVIGISIRLVTGDIIAEGAEFKTKPFDVRPKIKEMVNRIKQVSEAHIVLAPDSITLVAIGWSIWSLITVSEAKLSSRFPFI